MNRRARLPSPLLAALLSALLPGAGQWYAGARRRAMWMIGVAIALLTPALIVVVLLFGPWEISGRGLAVDLIRPYFRHPNLLLTLFAALVALLAFRAFAVIDALLAARRRPWRPGRAAGVALALGLLLAAVAWPHVWAGEQALALHDFVTTDFTRDPAQAPTTTTVPPTTTTLPATTTTGEDGTTAPTTTTTAPPPTTTTTTAPDPFGGAEWITIALLGGDAGPGRWGIRTDTIIVVAVAPASGRAAMFSIPRNQVQWPIPADIPAHGAFAGHSYPEITNTIYAYGLEHPDLFPGGPNSGGNAVKAILGEGLGLRIDYFALVDLLGFVHLVDALGGIDIYVTKPVNDPQQVWPNGQKVDVRIGVGQHHFDGLWALAYARVRQQDTDYHRMDRQRCVLEAAVAQADTLTLLRRFSDLLPIVQANLRTDIPVGRFPDLIDLLGKVDTGAVTAVRFMPRAPELSGTGTSFISGVDERGYSIPNVEVIRATVQAVLAAEPGEPGTGVELPTLEEVCRAG
ncbi:MAG: LytR family transcriptional regulator [Actinobacteria bacterium]|nr:LytR family transcriptional regulator [Actinomycetota bacterium]